MLSIYGKNVVLNPHFHYKIAFRDKIRFLLIGQVTNDIEGFWVNFQGYSWMLKSRGKFYSKDNTCPQRRRTMGTDRYVSAVVRRYAIVHSNSNCFIYLIYNIIWVKILVFELIRYSYCKN